MLVAYQAEYRFPIFRGLDGALFGGFANVAGSFNRLRLDRMRPTAWAGFRLRTDREKRIPIRLDAAFGENSVRFDLSLGEAF